MIAASFNVRLKYFGLWANVQRFQRCWDETPTQHDAYALVPTVQCSSRAIELLCLTAVNVFHAAIPCFYQTPFFFKRPFWSVYFDDKVRLALSIRHGVRCVASLLMFRNWNELVLEVTPGKTLTIKLQDKDVFMFIKMWATVMHALLWSGSQWWSQHGLAGRKQIIPEKKRVGLKTVPPTLKGITFHYNIS